MRPAPAPTQCASLKCVDGVCCNSACTGQCESCATGTCLPAPAGTQQSGNRPPCTGTGVCQASCDGVTRNQCTAYPGLDVVCNDPVCEGGWLTTYGCGGNGTCHPTTTNCGLFVCNVEGTACLTTCQDDDDCIDAAHCANGVCQGDGPLGQPCTDPAQCQSGVCADGVCCDRACDAPNEACDLPATAGTCTCVPRTTCAEGECGGVDDGCGGTLECEPCGCPEGTLTCGEECLCGCSIELDCETCRLFEPTARVCPAGSSCVDRFFCVAEVCTPALSGQVQCVGQGETCVCGMSAEQAVVCVDIAFGSNCPRPDQCQTSQECPSGTVCVPGGTVSCTFSACLPVC